MGSQKTKILAIISLLVLIVIVIVTEDSQDEQLDHSLNRQKTKAIVKTEVKKSAVANQKKKLVAASPIKKVVDNDQLMARRVKLDKKIEVVRDKLDACRNRARDLVKESDLQKLEGRVWDIEDGKRPLEERQEVEALILEKIEKLSSLDWHMKEVKELTNLIMDEELAMSDPQWALKAGGMLRPCGLYNTHRLFSIWTELIPAQIDNPQRKGFVEKMLLNHTKSLLKEASGAASVAMQVELLAQAVDKGYFNATMKEAIKDLERRMNEEMDTKFESSDGSTADLVKSILLDHQEMSSTLTEALDIVNSYSIGGRVSSATVVVAEIKS